MVKLTALPMQLPICGVTVMVAVSVLVTPAAVKLRLPAPEAASPMAVLEFVQLKVVPGGLPVKLTFTVCPPQVITGAGWVTVGVGLTVMVKVWAGPVQPLWAGVTVMVPVCGVATLDAVKLMFPKPPPDRPMAVLLFVQL